MLSVSLRPIPIDFEWNECGVDIMAKVVRTDELPDDGDWVSVWVARTRSGDIGAASAELWSRNARTAGSDQALPRRRRPKARAGRSACAAP
jgi:hypothetical protein